MALVVALKKLFYHFSRLSLYFPDFFQVWKIAGKFQDFFKNSRLCTNPVTYTIPSREPKVWSNIGPVPEVGVEPLFRVQLKLSEVSWMKPHVSFWKSQTIKKTYLLNRRKQKHLLTLIQVLTAYIIKFINIRFVCFEVGITYYCPD